MDKKILLEAFDLALDRFDEEGGDLEKLLAEEAKKKIKALEESRVEKIEI